MIQRNAIAKMAYLDETPLIVRLPRAEMYPDPDQPRKRRSQEKLEGLAQSMLTKQLQPCLVRQVAGRDGYMIVIGEGRWLGAGINEEKLQTPQFLDCILVDEENVGKIRLMQLMENIQREDMNELDIANGYRELIELGECPNGKAVAERMGVSAATVSVFLKVLDAPEPIKQLVEKGITKIDTARTLMMLAEINKARADALVQEALDTNMLKRSSVRDAYADEKARAENAAAAAEAAHEAGQQLSAPTVALEVQQQDPVESPQPLEPQDVIAADSTPIVTQPAPSPATVPEAHQKAVEGAPAAAESAGKDVTEKTLKSAPSAPLNAEKEVVKPAAPQAPTPAANPAPAVVSEQPSNDTPVAPADSPLIVADKFDVLVSIRSGTQDEERFIGLDVEYGNARLASHIVHREPSRAWVQFGTSKDHEQMQAFNCSDLEIVKVVQRA